MFITTTKTLKTLSLRSCLALLCFSLNSQASVTDISDNQTTTEETFQLSPYQATYKANIKGLSATLTRTLNNKSDGLWLLENNASLFLANIEESSLFKISQQNIEPLSYHYKNPLSSKRNSDLQFDWAQNNVRNGNNAPLTLKKNSFDKLGFQMQLRMDLIRQGDSFKHKTYHLVDKDRLKTYRVERLSEENITTDVGEFKTVKLKQFRPGKNKHTIIWLATDWQYLIIRLERFEDGKSENSLQLKEANFNGKPLIASPKSS